MRDDEADERFEDDGRDGEDAGLLHHHPEGLALEQELEVAEADEALHRLVERREMHRIERRIEHQQRDQQDQRQRHEEGDGRLALHGWRSPERLRAGPALRFLEDGVDHSDLAHCGQLPRPGEGAAARFLFVAARHSAPSLPRTVAREGIGSVQVRRKPSTSLSAQASVFPWARPAGTARSSWSGSPACRSARRSWAGPVRPPPRGSGGCAGWDSDRACPWAALLGPGLERSVSFANDGRS